MPVQLFPDPLRNVVQGIMEAHGLKQQIAQAALQQQRARMMEEDQKRSQEDAARRRQMEDIQSLQMLEGAARPVQAGTVSEKATLDTSLEGLPAGLAAAPAEAQFLRKPDPARLVRYKTADGQQREFELLSRPDQEARAIEQLKTKAGVEGQIDAERFKKRAEITDTFKEKDRALARDLQEGRITYQQYAAEVAQRAKAGETAASQQFQKELQGMRDASAMERTNVSASSRLTAAAQKAKGGGDDALVQTIIANPAAFENLTPTARTRIMPKLAEAGFTGFGGNVAAADVRKLGELSTALTGLDELRSTMEAGKEFVGPIAGWQALNPYSQARQVRAEIDLVRQRVGKALEGGVLRKEDEEKYKKILPTLNDTMETASRKIEMLKRSISNDIAASKATQKAAGKRLDVGGAAAPTDPLGIR